MNTLIESAVKPKVKLEIGSSVPFEDVLRLKQGEVVINLFPQIGYRPAVVTSAPAWYNVTGNKNKGFIHMRLLSQDENNKNRTYHYSITVHNNEGRAYMNATSWSWGDNNSLIIKQEIEQLRRAGI